MKEAAKYVCDWEGMGGLIETIVYGAIFLLTIIDNDELRIAINLQDSNYVTLCFTGVGHGIGGVEIQSEEFRKSSNHSTAIFIVDKLRSWGNNIDFSKLKEIVLSKSEGKIINAVGNSMGGFLAILMTKFINIKNVVSIVPQFSVHKDVFPNEDRWDSYISTIARWNYIDLSDAFNDVTEYYIFSGAYGADGHHIERMPNKHNVHKILFRGSRFNHSVAKALKEDGILYDVIRECFSSADANVIISKHLQKEDYGAFLDNKD